jgi:hypothetical protein
MTLLKSQMDDLVDQIDLDDDSAEHRQLAAEVTDAFKGIHPSALENATSALWQYYQSVVAEYPAEERRAYGIPDVEPGADIWEQVSFRFSPTLSAGDKSLAPARAYLSFEGEVSWEPEYGLQLVFEDGVRVCKVGPYDGHSTVAHAFGDASLLGVIFR